MGLLSWFFPSPADRVAKARKLLAAGREADARLEVLGLEEPEAQALMVEAENALVLKNLEAAVSWARTGDDRRVHLHLELAEQFHHGGHEQAFRDARREMREIRAERSTAEKRAKEERETKLLAADPLGLQGGPSLLDPQLPDDMFDEDREELEARLALMVENYPEKLRDGITQLGAPFARAVLDLEDGRADRALSVLLDLPDGAPLVCWERARAALALGDPKAAARAARQFANAAGGHFQMGSVHSGVFLAQVTAQAGDMPGALRIIRGVRAQNERLGGLLFAQLLEATGELAEAEGVLTGLIRDNSRQRGLYQLLARVRLRGGHRMPAMKALEASLNVGCSTPGKCGYQPPNLDILRTLATLYLEDGIERPRALELAGQAASLVEKRTWEDTYLAALAARASGDPEAKRIVDTLRSSTPEGPLQARLQQHLA